jgi:hypothetical protein
LVRSSIGGAGMKIKWMFIGLFFLVVIKLITMNPQKKNMKLYLCIHMLKQLKFSKKTTI